MSKWALLKTALTEGRQDHSNQASIHRFAGFNLMNRKKILWTGFYLSITIDSDSNIDSCLQESHHFMEMVDTTEIIVEVISGDPTRILQFHEKLLSMRELRILRHEEKSISFYFSHKTLIPTLSSCEYCCYSFPNSLNSLNSIPLKPLYTREKPKSKGPGLKALFSNRLHNVDNTGNICVWPAEPILLFTILTNPSMRRLVEGRSCLELGGGLAGLVGLGLAVNEVVKEVLTTDGHPDCVVNQKVCAQMCRQQGVLKADFPISSKVLHWKDTDLSTIKPTLLREESEKKFFNQQGFEVIIACDCLFFKEFHDDLVNCLRILLSKNGVIILLQPSRHGSMEKFLKLCENDFTTEIIQDYCSELSRQRNEIKSKIDDEKIENKDYDEDIHFPILVLLRLKV